MDKKIWGLAKWRFLQSEAKYWFLANKSLELLFLISAVLWGYLEFFSPSGSLRFKYLFLVVSVVALGMMMSRKNSFTSYLGGYESGFKDAATKNLDYWGETHSPESDNDAISSVMRDITNNEKKIDEENIVSRDAEVKEGFSKLVGFILTWRKLQ